MDFELNEEQMMFKDTVRRLMENQCPFDSRKPVIDAGSFSEEHWHLFAEQGLLGLALPEECDGLGYSAIETALVTEEIGRVLCVEPYTPIAVVAAQTLLACNDETSRALLSNVSNGSEKPVLAHTEATARGRVSHVTTRATRNGEAGWTLNGRKTSVVAGNIADHLIVSARTSGDINDTGGISLFLVNPTAKGVSKKAFRMIDNRWAIELDLNDVTVSEDDLLGSPDQGIDALLRGHAHTMIAEAAEAIGVMEQALWLTRDYLKVRKQFGQTLSNFQSLQHRMSEMLIELELSRGMLHYGLSSMTLDQQRQQKALSAMKAHIGRSGQFVCGQAIQLHGGIGVTEEYTVGHYFKRMTLINGSQGSTRYHFEQLAELERTSPPASDIIMPA